MGNSVEKIENLCGGHLPEKDNTPEYLYPVVPLIGFRPKRKIFAGIIQGHVSKGWGGHGLGD